MGINIVMEYAPSTLKRELEKVDSQGVSSTWIGMEPPAPGQYGSAYRIVYELSSAMSYLHRNMLLHLDLKPDNILMCYSNTAVDDRQALMDEWHRTIGLMPDEVRDDNGSIDKEATEEAKRVKQDKETEFCIKMRIVNENAMICKLADFGLSEVTTDYQQGRTRKAGSPGYVAPEVAHAIWAEQTNDLALKKRLSVCDAAKESVFLRAEHRHPEDHLRYKQDIYAFGVTCSAIYTQNKPYADPDHPGRYPDDSVDLLVAAAKRELPAPYLPPGICPNLAARIAECLQESPNDRPRFNQIRDALSCYVKAKRHKLQLEMQGRAAAVAPAAPAPEAAPKRFSKADFVNKV